MTSGKPSQLVGWFLVSFLTLKKLTTQRGELGFSLNSIRLVSADNSLVLSNAFCHTDLSRFGALLFCHATLLWMKAFRRVVFSVYYYLLSDLMILLPLFQRMSIFLSMSMTLHYT